MELLEQVESYLAQTRMPASSFGRLAVGDPRFVEDLRSGRHPRRKTQQRVQAFLTQASEGAGVPALATSRLNSADNPKPQSDTCGHATESFAVQGRDPIDFARVRRGVAKKVRKNEVDMSAIRGLH